ncbi:hypothetical protein FYK55_24405 [Roseiconus nitratireducens]|uniref:Secreted protein n=1 Tax=Roseiconus nitratireducens TaxID=2605748 RepID=A0A5M6CW70_9BACT|nr:hypothetical protein [Roseiconus nitratireducens]KAA5539478.1 hypothetical protein FYK55_24405 [Roseiconus nitratireducens]
MALNRTGILTAVVLMTGIFAPASLAQNGSGRQRALVTTLVQAADQAPTDSDVSTLDSLDSGTGDLPASITQPRGILTLAPAGIQALPAARTVGHGCHVCPDVSCTGPLYSGCSPRLYYGTNPRDDDPILPLYPRINDVKTNHWYSAARRMVHRKQSLAEAIK